MKNYLLHKLLVCIGWVSSKLSTKVRITVAKKISQILTVFNTKRLHIALENISISFPEKDVQWCKSIAYQSNENLVVTMFEFLALPFLEKSKVVSMFSFPDNNLLGGNESTSKGGILLSAHFGNWELGAFSFGLFYNSPITIVVKEQRNKFVSDLFNQYRTSGNNTIVKMDNAAKEMIATVKNGGIVGILADQAADPNKDVFINFFGRPAVTFEAPATLALRYNVPIILIFSIRQNDGNYKVVIEKLDIGSLTNTSENRRLVMTKYNESLERLIRKYPGMWSWQHKRWKYNIEHYTQR